MSPSPPILTKIILQPHFVQQLCIKEWEQLIHQARAASLLPRLAVVLKEHGLFETVPQVARRHLIGALNILERQQIAAANEVHYLRLAMSDAGLPLVLLKGMAYVAAEAPPGRARIFSDFDILVPKHCLGQVEQTMFDHGWRGDHHDAYDERYYREWMHELPPLMHRQRRSVLDIHHSITPETARIKTDSSALLERVVPSSRFSGVWTMQPADIILHCTVHLFNEGEFERGLRDLFDLQDLVEYYLQEPDDWQQLHNRALELGLQEPLAHGMKAIENQFSDYRTYAGPDARWQQATSARSRFVDNLLHRVLIPPHESCETPMTALARLLLFIRGHAMRMPLRLLIPHLFRKWRKSMNLLRDPDAPV
ncbi:nucleotidyltransferase family protein [Congregibacter variabilis]|uniref:Nucleotidyltransferase family protein n=1 Tax=Congregibacter variabilis TaxID=3081200 RepID=A0ABZ0I8G1_9GAMM|nr:nucleotidyltransferase family protein [Congregibacter sp. IMCC43200]